MQPMHCRWKVSQPLSMGSVVYTFQLETETQIPQLQRNLDASTSLDLQINNTNSINICTFLTEFLLPKAHACHPQALEFACTRHQTIGCMRHSCLWTFVKESHSLGQSSRCSLISCREEIGRSKVMAASFFDSFITPFLRLAFASARPQREVPCSSFSSMRLSTLVFVSVLPGSFTKVTCMGNDPNLCSSLGTRTMRSAPCTPQSPFMHSRSIQELLSIYNSALFQILH